MIEDPFGHDAPPRLCVHRNRTLNTFCAAIDVRSAKQTRCSNPVSERKRTFLGKIVKR